MSIVHIVLEHTGKRNNGMFRASLEGGAVLVEASEAPELEACIALLARGIIGTAAFKHIGAEFVASRCNIKAVAEKTIRERERARSALNRRLVPCVAAIDQVPAP
jgi:hypothetical protein